MSPEISSSFAQSGAHLSVTGVSFSYPSRRVLTDISFTVSAGQRVGLIGENGCGKSTLLEVVAGKLTPDSGTVNVNCPAHAQTRIGLLDQEPNYSLNRPVSVAIEDAVAPVRSAVAEANALAERLVVTPEDPQVLKDYGDALDNVERLGAWTLESRIGEVLAGLGLAHISRGQMAGVLSGGERARLSLACLLLSGPDVLLLDEPTNHLDDSAVAYLGETLTGWEGPILLSSHDRAFLDETATKLIDMDPSPLPHSFSSGLLEDGTGTGIGTTQFSGNFSDYVLARTEARDRWQRQYHAEQDELGRLRAAAKQQTVGHAGRPPRTEAKAAQKFYADRNARVVSRRLNDAKGKLAQLEAEQIRKPPADLTFTGLPAAGKSKRAVGTGPALVATEVGVAGRLEPVSFSVGWGEHWLITGPNGSGKSTLAAVLAGDLTPSHGNIFRAGGTRIAMLSQEVELPRLTSGDPYQTAAQVYAANIGHNLAERTPLGTFGLIAGRDIHVPFAELSVGTQRRVALAILLAEPPDVLLLDEPTNHFSLSLVMQLEAAIMNYTGTVIVISHDRWLRDRWRGYQLALPSLAQSVRTGR